MISYEVTTRVNPRLAPDFEAYMRGEHVPELLATGCFGAASFAAAGEPGVYRSAYLAPDQAALDRYLADHATRLRDHVRQRFPEGLESTRETWNVLQVW